LRAQVDRLLQPDVFSRPDIVLSLQLVGAPADGSAALEGGLLTPLEGTPDAVATALSHLDATALPQTCDAAVIARVGGCSEHDVASCVATLLEMPAAETAALPASVQTSIACFLASLRATVAAPDAAGLITARLDVSAVTDAKVVSHLLAAAKDSIQAARGDAAAMQIVFLDAAPSAALSAPREMGAGHLQKMHTVWNAAPTSRHLLAPAPSPSAAPPPPPMVRDVNAWYAKVAGFGVGVMLMVAAIGTVVALCTLPTGQDTLLYARTKSD